MTYLLQGSRLLARTKRRINIFTLAIAAFLALPLLSPARANAPKAAPARPAILHLIDGGYVAGTLADSNDATRILWQGAAFTTPFAFAPAGVVTIDWPPPEKWPVPKGHDRFELAGGDVAYGSLVELDDQHAVLDVAHRGRVHLDRANLLRLDRWHDGDRLIYLGPNGLAGWQEIPAFSVNRVEPSNRFRNRNVADAAPAPVLKDQWKEQSGQLLTDREGATLYNPLGIPARAVLEFELSWTAKPDFVFAVGVGPGEKDVQHGFRFEVWDNDLVACRETEHEADVAAVGRVDGAGRIHLLAFLDQDNGRMRVYSPLGKQLADLKLAITPQNGPTGVYLSNLHGDVRLERLQISRWTSDPPQTSDTSRSRVERTDGSVVFGNVDRLDEATHEYVVREEKGESRVPADQVANIVFALPGEPPARAVRAVLQDGTRLSGDLMRVEHGTVVLKAPGIEEPLQLESGELRSLIVLQHASKPSDDPKAILEMDGVRLSGQLVDGQENAQASALAWKPAASASASPLRPGGSGKIVASWWKPPPPAETKPASRVPQPAPAPGLGGLILKAFSGNPQQPRAPENRRSLYLRTGDIIPAEVTSIDENGVTFRTPLSPKTHVPHDKVKAVELAQETVISVRLNKSKRERLLTLPRMQKDSPPTQLIRSKNGDYLRGRIVHLDAKILRLEIRLETKDIPRDRVSRIIWFHPDELAPPKEPEKAAAADAPTRVQAVRNDGNRLTFYPERLENGTLYGKSDVLGGCQVPISEIGQLFLGSEIQHQADQLAYQRWRLQNAPEPVAAQEGSGEAGGGGPTGGESPMVGKPAPDFELDLLKGEKFQLSKHQGKVVILDFWATWCGPCLQAMPQVERVAQEFKDRGVELFAVNLQEAPKVITAMLERHKLNMTVALDKEGLVAEKYSATAIPQTVIVDRDGKVARLFVGGGPRFEDTLRDAVRTVLDGKPKEPVKP